MKTKAFGTIVLMSFLVITMFAAVPTKASVAPIIIGVMGPTSQYQGEGMTQGAILARDEINALGGI